MLLPSKPVRRGLHHSLPMALKPLTIYYQNVHGIRTKSVDIAEFVLCAPLLCTYCFTETWLNSSCCSSDYFPSRYTVYHTDRVSDTGDDVRGGDILTAVPDVSRSARRSDLETNCCTWVELWNKHVNTLFGVYYVPPGTSHEHFQVPLDEIQGKLARYNGQIYLCGDFNLLRVYWSNLNSDDCSPAVASKFVALSLFASYCNLRQVNKV